MTNRITALLLLLALASMATAAPACVSKAIATPAVTECVIASAPHATINAEPAVFAHELVAILPSAGCFDVPSSVSRATVPDTGAAVLDRQPLLVILRI